MYENNIQKLTEFEDYNSFTVVLIHLDIHKWHKQFR